MGPATAIPSDPTGPGLRPLDLQGRSWVQRARRHRNAGGGLAAADLLQAAPPPPPGRCACVAVAEAALRVVRDGALPDLVRDGAALLLVYLGGAMKMDGGELAGEERPPPGPEEGEPARGHASAKRLLAPDLARDQVRRRVLRRRSSHCREERTTEAALREGLEVADAWARQEQEEEEEAASARLSSRRFAWRCGACGAENRMRCVTCRGCEAATLDVGARPPQPVAAGPLGAEEEDRADAALASAVRGGLFGGEASGRSFLNVALGAGGARL